MTNPCCPLTGRSVELAAGDANVARLWDALPSSSGLRVVAGRSEASQRVGLLRTQMQQARAQQRQQLQQLHSVLGSAQREIQKLREEAGRLEDKHAAAAAAAGRAAQERAEEMQRLQQQHQVQMQQQQRQHDQQVRQGHQGGMNRCGSQRCRQWTLAASLQLPIPRLILTQSCSLHFLAASHP